MKKKFDKAKYDEPYPYETAEELNARFEKLNGDCHSSGVKFDLVDHPPHYTNHPSGVECIEVTEHMNFCLGNAVKYLWRAGEKGNYVQDLQKAIWYINREIERTQNA